MTAASEPIDAAAYRPIVVVAGLAYLAAVLWVTLGPVPWAQDSLAENPFGILNPAAWTDRATWLGGRPLEFLANVAMFIPLGLIAATIAGDSRLILAAPFALSLAIELVQIALPDRASDPRDLVANALGALVGNLIARSRRLRRIAQDTR